MREERRVESCNELWIERRRTIDGRWQKAQGESMFMKVEHKGEQGERRERSKERSREDGDENQKSEGGRRP